jgi:hypothetical protein
MVGDGGSSTAAGAQRAVKVWLKKISLKTDHMRNSRSHTSHAKLPLVEFENGKTYEGEWLNGQPRKRRRRRHLPGDNPRQIFEVTDKHGGWEYPAFNSTRTLKQQQNGTGHGGFENNLNGRIVKAPKRRIVKAQRSGAAPNVLTATPPPTSSEPLKFLFTLKFSFTPASGGGFVFFGSRNGKLPLVKFDGGNAYEGEWLNDKRHGRGIYTWASGNR